MSHANAGHVTVMYCHMFKICQYGALLNRRDYVLFSVILQMICICIVISLKIESLLYSY